MVYRQKPAYFHPRFEVVSCFCEFENKILLLQTHTNKDPNAVWGVPGGKVENGETLEQAMVREMKEETGIIFDNPPLVFLDTVYIKFAKFDFTYHMFKMCFAKEPEVIIDHREHSNFVWLTPAEALKKELIEDEDYCIKMQYKI